MNKKKFSNRFWSGLIIVVTIYIIYSFGFAFLNNHLVDEDAIHTRAIIIDEENVYANGGHIGNEFSYSYEFHLDGKKYRGNSHDATLKVGDSVEVKYYKNCPYFNKPVHPKE